MKYQNKEPLKKFIFLNISGFINFMVSIAYIFLTYWSFSIFNCETYDSVNGARNVKDSSILCSYSDPSFIVFQIFAFITIVIYVLGVNLLLLFLLIY